MRAVLDTSVLIADDAPADGDFAISTVSLGELHFGLLLARTDEERARRSQRLAVVEATFSPLPVSAAVARAWGALAALVVRRGVQPRRRNADLLIAATAQVHDAVLLTHNVGDFAHVEDQLRVMTPRELGG